MANLRVKKIKGHEYFYWCRSARSRKKFGGDGRVKTVDHLIGKHPLGDWLAYHLWTKEINLQEYVQAVIRWNIGFNKWQKLIDFTIDWEKNKVSLKGLIPPMRMMGVVFGVDCRSKPWKKVREDFQDGLNQIVERSTWIETIIERAAYRVGLHNQCLAEAKELRETAKDARLHPDQYKPDADLYLDEYASESEAEADKLMQRYLEVVNDKLLVFAPPKQRSSFRAEVIRKAENLAKDQRWLEQYRAKLDRS